MSAPDFSLGFVDVRYINTFLNLILTKKPLLARDVYIWLDKKGYRSKKADNTLLLLEYASVIKVVNRHYVVTEKFLKASNDTNQEEALKRFVLAPIPEDDLRLFVKNAYTPYVSSLVWRPEFISPFLVQLRDFLMSLQLLHYEHGFIKATSLFIHHLESRGLIDMSQPEGARTVSNEDLLIALETKNELGELAEKLALKFEKLRTAKFGKQPVLISKENVAAGYDIDSYENSNSSNFDRHIEVKYFNNKHFYISKNEIETAKVLGSHYWIYLVTVENEDKCRVEMVSDPYSNIINSDDWTAESVLLKVGKVRNRNAESSS